MHEVPQIILQQLGGRRAVAMTGAKAVLGTSDSLLFRLPGTPGFVKDGINAVTIRLDPSDTYTITCRRLRGSTEQTVAVEEGVYWDMLHAVFTRLTGLDTHL